MIVFQSKYFHIVKLFQDEADTKEKEKNNPINPKNITSKNFFIFLELFYIS